MNTFLASSHDSVKNLFGTVAPPPGTPPDLADKPQDALIRIMNVGLTGVMIVAGLYTILNIVLAGFMYITSSGDAKRAEEANRRISHSVIGLAIIVLTPLAAAIIGIVIFGKWDAILNPEFKKVSP